MQSSATCLVTVLNVDGLPDEDSKHPLGGFFVFIELAEQNVHYGVAIRIDSSQVQRALVVGSPYHLVEQLDCHVGVQN